MSSKKDGVITGKNFPQEAEKKGEMLCEIHTDHLP